MSKLDHDLAIDFLRTTSGHEHARHAAIIAAFPNSVIAEAALASISADLPPLSSEELATRSEERVEAETDAQHQAMDAQEAFEQRFTALFGTVDGYAPSIVDAGRLHLYKREGDTFTNLDAAMFDGKLVLAKSTAPAGTTNERTPLPTTDEDYAVLGRVLTQLTVTTERMSGM